VKTLTNPPKATSDQVAVDLQKQIKKRWNDAAEGIVEVGNLLIEAKNKLGHGRWQKFTEGLPFSDRMAEMLMKIARNPILSNPKHVSNLPRSWATLYRMTYLPDGELEQMLENGTIKSDTTRPKIEKHIKKLNGRYKLEEMPATTRPQIKEHNKHLNGRYEFERIAEALHTLIHYMGKWIRSKSDPEEYV